MKILLRFFPFFSIVLAGCEQEGTISNNNSALIYSESITMQNEILFDKIKGGWAGQVIGCTYGGPTEFQFCGTMIQDYIPIPWDENRMKWYFDNVPGLYDDVYMDLTFVEVFEKEGLDAPAISHARAFAHADYKLWHANQAARYNILNGIEPPASGYWENNPHSEDIDFQIEVFIDNVLHEKVKLPTNFIKRRNEICWKYNLKKETHLVKIRLINAKNDYSLLLNKILIYTNKN